MTTVSTKKHSTHPLEDVFDISPGTTLTQTTEIISDPIVQLSSYDPKDNEIENKLEDIYTFALAQAGITGDQTELVEGKYKARVAEVTATMLNVALSAVREKAALKMHKDKIAVSTISASTPGTVNQNLIVGSQSEILKMILDSKRSSSEE